MVQIGGADMWTIRTTRAVLAAAVEVAALRVTRVGFIEQADAHRVLRGPWRIVTVDVD